MENRNIARLTPIVFLSCLLIFSISIHGQDTLTKKDEAALVEASKTADQFISHFRQTLDFATAWKEFRRQNIKCMVRSNGVISDTMRERLKLKDAYLEKVYVSMMNFYFLRWAYGASLHKMSDKGDVWADPTEIVKYQESSRFLRNDDGEDPKTLRGINEMIVEMNHVSRLYKKYMPKNALTNEIWRANIKYFEEYQPANNSGVEKGWAQMCVPDTVKLYTFERGPFYFYFVREKRKLKIAGFGID